MRFTCTPGSRPRNAVALGLDPPGDDMDQITFEEPGRLGAQPALGGVRLAELLAALSLATDLGTGQPIGHTLRTCLLALHLGQTLDLSERELSDVYYVALLRGIGCTADAHEEAASFGNDIAATMHLAVVDMAQPREMLRFLFRHVGEGQPLPQRARMILAALAAGPSGAQEAITAHCEASRLLAAQFEMSESVSLGLSQVFERWDGRGWPGQLKGTQSQLSARIVQLARDAEVFYRLGGPEAARAVARQRKAAKYDPALAEQFCAEAPRLLATLEQPSAWEAVLAAEPGPQRRLTEDQLERATQAMADFVDLKSPYLSGHSRGVAALAEAAARHLGCSEAEAIAIRQAGYLHDLGRVGISSGIWDKARPLTDEEWEQVRLHPYYTERVLARPAALARLGALAACHHERLDASGYHRHIPASLLSTGGRILAAADVYHALLERRPYRPASPPDAAAATLRQEVQSGRLDGDAVQAVLAVAGHPARATRRAWPAGLSEREVEVLRLIACGLSKREIGKRLIITEKTAGHHIQHIYNKIGVSTRASATLFAMQHHLLDDLTPFAE